MNKKWIAVVSVIGIIGTLTLTGCNQSSLFYQGKERSVYEVEEMIGDYLESENPNLDIDVTITQNFD